MDREWHAGLTFTTRPPAMLEYNESQYGYAGRALANEGLAAQALEIPRTILHSPGPPRPRLGEND
ncbi:hypothetical protein GCM10017687_84040 [Streptomyces echinatus]